MSFMSSAQLQKKVSLLLTKLTRQQAALDQTDQEIAHWENQIELLKKGSAPKS